jgi:hypothetical protein
MAFDAKGGIFSARREIFSLTRDLLGMNYASRIFQPGRS